MAEAMLEAVSLASLMGMAVLSAVWFKGASVEQKAAIALFPASQVALAVFLFEATERAGLGVGTDIVIGVACIACAGADALLFRAAQASQRRNLDEEKAAIFAAQLELHKEYAKRLEQDAERAASLRSQLVEELRFVEGRLESGDFNAVETHLAHVSEGLKIVRKSYCANRVVDVLMAEKGWWCKNEGVTLTCSLDVRSDLPFSPVDLCALFANVMDNAINACALCSSKGRFITMRAGEAAGHFVIDVENSCLEQAGKDSGRKPARGLGEHGWGLSILGDIAAKYGGIAEVAQENGVFRTTVMLALPAEAK